MTVLAPSRPADLRKGPPQHDWTLVTDDGQPCAFQEDCEAEVDGVVQVVSAQGDGWVRSYVAETGEKLWEFDTNPRPTCLMNKLEERARSFSKHGSSAQRLGTEFNKTFAITVRARSTSASLMSLCRTARREEAPPGIIWRPDS